MVIPFVVPASNSLAQDLSDVINRAEKSVIRIEVAGTGGDALGSGFVVSETGVFVTNVHVMSGASRAMAHFEDGRAFEISGTYLIDVPRDICIGQLKSSPGLKFEPITVSDKVPRKGEQIVALGCPQGLSFSATRGIISAIRERDEFREMVGRPKMEGTWIQVDAAVSGGNSGGPMINSVGEVVAMSTLASRGDAQNLNFGVSASDIREALSKINPAELTALPEGIGKLELAEVSPETSETFIGRSEIPTQALQEYIDQGRQNYRDLVRDLRRYATETKKTYDLMRKGEPFIPSAAGANPNTEYVFYKDRKQEKYFFRSEATKKIRVAEKQSLMTVLNEVASKLGREPDNDSLYQLLTHGGPFLDPRRANKVGFMRDATVIHAYNEHDVAVVYDDLPYLLWVKSTAGLAAGQTIAPCMVYVAGTKTVEIPGKTPRSITVLNTVTETELHEAIFGSTNNSIATSSDDVHRSHNDSVESQSKEYRIWTDNTGRFSIEAVLVESKGGNVRLRKRDGSEVSLPIEKLSVADRKLVD